MYQIGKRMGRSVGAISWHCLINGVERFDGAKGYPPSTTGRDYNRNGRPVRAYTPDEDTTLLEMAKSGIGYGVIAKRIGRRHSSIQGRLAILARREERAGI